MLGRCLILTAAAALAMPAPLAAGDLKVEIRGLPSTAGTVDVALFDGPDRFLGKPVAGVRLSAKESPLVATFAGLAPGTYAVSTFHDANENGSLDKNLLGLPTEKYGFSRDAARLMGPPRFEDAAFTIGPDHHLIIINLR
jgi:uncharacterized protein (DUF2141 family)